MSLAEHSRALRKLLAAAAEYSAEVAAEHAAEAAAAEAAENAAAAEKASRLEADGGGGGGGGKKTRKSPLSRLMGRKGSSSEKVHPTKACLICLEPLGTEGGVQALGCMDAFCRFCIATHIETRSGDADGA